MKRIIVTPLFVFILILFTSNISAQEFWITDNDQVYVACPETMQDDDGNTYSTIMIGSQCWMAENLNWDVGTSWCYDFNPANCQIYGRLYNINASKIACPAGWHLPTSEEWCQLIGVVDPEVDNCPILFPENEAGGSLKSNSPLWSAPNTGATNSSGFTALPGGMRNSDAHFYSLSNIGYFWSDDDDIYFTEVFWMFHDSSTIDSFTAFEDECFSIRCIKD